MREKLRTGQTNSGRAALEARKRGGREANTNKETELGNTK